MKLCEMIFTKKDLFYKTLKARNKLFDSRINYALLFTWFGNINQFVRVPDLFLSILVFIIFFRVSSAPRVTSAPSWGTVCLVYTLTSCLQKPGRSKGCAVHCSVHVQYLYSMQLGSIFLIKFDFFPPPPKVLSWILFPFVNFKCVSQAKFFN